MRKALFLDVDGVLNSAAWFAEPRSTEGDYLGLRSLDPTAVALLKRVLDETGAEVVLSSTWRLEESFVHELVNAGIPIADRTPYVSTNHRGEEIAAWLTAPERSGPVDAPFIYAVVDDDADAGDHVLTRDVFVRTSFAKGLQEEHAHSLIALLNA